jgi:hypothetical protein
MQPPCVAHCSSSSQSSTTTASGLRRARRIAQGTWLQGTCLPRRRRPELIACPPPSEAGSGDCPQASASHAPGMKAGNTPSDNLRSGRRKNLGAADATRTYADLLRRTRLSRAPGGRRRRQGNAADRARRHKPTARSPQHPRRFGSGGALPRLAAEMATSAAPYRPPQSRSPLGAQQPAWRCRPTRA